MSSGANRVFPPEILPLRPSLFPFTIAGAAGDRVQDSLGDVVLSMKSDSSSILLRVSSVYFNILFLSPSSPLNLGDLSVNSFTDMFGAMTLLTRFISIIRGIGGLLLCSLLLL